MSAGRETWPVPAELRGHSPHDCFLWYVADGWRRIYGPEPAVATVYAHDAGRHVLRKGNWQLTLVDVEQFPAAAAVPPAAVVGTVIAGALDRLHTEQIELYQRRKAAGLDAQAREHAIRARTLIEVRRVVRELTGLQPLDPDGDRG